MRFVLLRTWRRYNSDSFLLKDSRSAFHGTSPETWSVLLLIVNFLLDYYRVLQAEKHDAEKVGLEIPNGIEQIAEHICISLENAW